MNNGWIKLHRKLLDNPLHNKPAWLSVWLHILVLANHEEKEFIWNGQKQKVRKGQFITGRLELAIKCGVSPSLVERVLKYLEIEHQIEQQKTTKYRVVTILNWDKYQESDTKSDNKRTTDGQQADTNKNYNNYKNDKKEHSDVPSQEIVQIIDSFKEVNSSYKTWFANKTQRLSIKRMLETHGIDRVLKVVAILPKSNLIPYMPVITTPSQLETKWSSLETGMIKKRNELQTKQRVVLI